MQGGPVIEKRLIACVLGALVLAGADPAAARAKKKKPLDSIFAAQVRETDLSKVAPPVDQEVCFAPDEPCDLKLVKFIDSAEKSIDMAIYDINLDQLVHHLLVKSKKIPVRIVVDQRQSRGAHSLVPTLIKGGISLRYGRQRGIMHDKFTIVDDKMVELGSFNYTNHATEANQENQLYIATPSVVERYAKRFEIIWANAKEVSEPPEEKAAPDNAADEF